LRIDHQNAKHLLLSCAFAAKTQSMTDLSGLSQFTLNLRWLVARKEPDPLRWASALSGMTRGFLAPDRASALLVGAPATPAEVRGIAEVSGRDDEELLSVPLFGGKDDVFRENLRYLLNALPQGSAKDAAQTLKVSASQLSRWKTGTGTPRPANVRNLLRFHGIDPDIDLSSVPLFLSMEPVGGFAQKQWVMCRLQEMPSDEVAKIFPALRRMVRYNEKN
jgi:hypothetical protein